ncbi:alpha/beta hydrolase, partial [Limosilactobacillus mucosae]|nr:alpha/beta hydrolase [Limosilactobacillus mucosae]
MDRKNFDHHILAAMADNLSNSLREMARCGHSRSKRATLTEMSIQLSGFKQTLADPQKRQELVESCRQTNRQPLKIPADVQFSVPVKLVTTPYPMIWLNQNSQARNLIVYLAGGAFIQRPLKWHWQFLNRLAQAADVEIVVPN